MINERIEAQGSSDKDEVEKEVAYLAKNLCKFLKFYKDGKFFEKGKFSNFKNNKKDSKRRIPKTLLLLKQSLVISAMGMVM